MPNANPATPDILARIMCAKRDEVARRSGETSLRALRDRAVAAGPCRGFVRSILGDESKLLSLIAEVKRSSPSAGAIKADCNPPETALAYARGGADAVSVLTDGPFFGGSLDDLVAVRGAVSLPCLRKDFILDEYQVWEARAAGADAILLIAECLEEPALLALRDVALALGMDCLIEIHDACHLDWVASAVSSADGRCLLGINNRDLRTFQVSISHTVELMPKLSGVPVVTESGVKSRADVEGLAAAGVRAALVGETLMRSGNPGQTISELFGRV